jgi:hypothetical protein
MPAQWRSMVIGLLWYLEAIDWMANSLAMSTWWNCMLCSLCISGGGGDMSMAMMRDVVGCEA